MTETKKTKEPQEKASSKKSKKTKGKRYYHYRIFWIFVIIVIGYLVVFLMNWAMNDREYQDRAAQYLYEKSQTKLDFTDITFNLFTGKVSGKDLTVHVEKSNLKLSLKEFTLKYNPYYLWIGRFKITGIYANEFFLDTSNLILPQKMQKKITMPNYLKRVKLSEAKINKFYWKQPKDGSLSIEDITLESKFGSVIYTSPLTMVLNSLEYRGPKHHAFLNHMELDGFFLFDFSQPLIFDESRLSAKLEVEDALLAFYRTPKPWLTDRAWDADLEPILKRYYPQKIPDDHTYIYINNAFVDLHKTKELVRLNAFRVKVKDAALEGRGGWQLQNHKFNLELFTKNSIPLSKMPLGQSKIRKAFRRFSFNLKANGKLYSLWQNDISLNLTAGLIQNLAHPEAGDVTGQIEGKIINGQFVSEKINIKLSDGSVTARSHINLKQLTTQTSFSAANLDVQTVIRLFSSVNIPSVADGTGSVNGKLKNPRIEIALTSQNATYEFLNFGPAKGNLLIDNKKMNFDIQSTRNEVGRSQLSMDINNVFNPMVQVMTLKSKFEDIDIKRLLLAQSLAGKIGGDFNLTRNRGIVSAKGHFLAKDFTFFDQRVGFIDFTANIKRKHADIKPIVIELEYPNKTLVSPTGLSFDFDPSGYRFSGTLIEGLKVSGHFEKANKNIVNLKFDANKLNLDIFSSILPVVPEKSSLTGRADLKYQIKNPVLSQMQSHISEWEIVSADGNFKLNRPGGLNYQSQAYVFRNFDVTVGQGRVLLNGPLGLENNTSLQIKGEVDFRPLVDFNPFVSESDTPISVDVMVRGDYRKPSVHGTITLDDDSIKFRKVLSDLSNMKGTLKFNGNRISSENLEFDYDDAPMTISGYITTDYEKVTGADLKIKGNEVPMYPFEAQLSLLTDMDLTLKGHGNMLLDGSINIVEGKYIRNLVITNFFVQPLESELEGDRETFAGLPLYTRYNIQVKNTGDMLIKNNLADLEMNLDLDLQGTIEKPKLLGQIDFLGGQINAFGITFDDAKGYAQFNRNSGILPDVTLTALKEIQGYNISANLDGKADNLRLRLYSSPALEHREILSLVFYGQTADQLSDADRRNFTQTAAISQLATILSGPLQKYYGLDVLEVSSRYDRPQETVQRLTVGKKLSDRFDLNFTTDLGIEDPERAFEIRYQVLDNFYFIAAKDVVGTNRYRFDVSFRFEAY